MRRLEVDFSRAIEINDKADAVAGLLRLASEKVRSARRRLQDKQREVEIWEQTQFSVEAHARADKGKPFMAGQAAHDLRLRDRDDATALLTTANARYASTAAEASYWGRLRTQMREYLAANFRERNLPAALRDEEF